MSETENVEQKASGAVVATAWVCDGCGDCREQVSAPTGCLTCERWAERRGKQPPDPDWSPLYSAAIVRHLIARVAELEAKIADAVFSCPGCGRHDFGFFASQIKAACGPCRTRAEVAKAREAQHLADIKALQILLHRWVSSYVGGRHGEDARSLVDVTYRALTGAPLAHYDDAKADAPASDAEIEARVLAGASKDAERIFQVRMIQSLRNQREAQHLADIKALRPLFERVKDAQFENYEDAYRAIYKCGGYDLIKQADAVFAHYDDAKADAPASDADIEARVLAGAFARRRKASTEGEATDE